MAVLQGLQHPLTIFQYSSLLTLFTVLMKPVIPKVPSLPSLEIIVRLEAATARKFSQPHFLE